MSFMLAETIRRRKRGEQKGIRTKKAGHVVLAIIIKQCGDGKANSMATNKVILASIVMEDGADYNSDGSVSDVRVAV